MNEADRTIDQLKAENARRAELKKFEAFRIAIENGKASQVKDWARELDLNAEQVQFAKMIVAAVTEFYAKQQEAEQAQRQVIRLSAELGALEEEAKNSDYITSEQRKRYGAIESELAAQTALVHSVCIWYADPRKSMPEAYALQFGGDWSLSYANQGTAGTFAGNFLIENGVSVVNGGTWRHLGREQPRGETSIWIEKRGSEVIESSYTRGGKQ